MGEFWTNGPAPVVQVHDHQALWIGAQSPDDALGGLGAHELVSGMDGEQHRIVEPKARECRPAHLVH